MMKWRLILHSAGSPSWNMAVDEALLREIEAPVLRIYDWDRPAQSIGYFQSWREAIPELPFVRRYTGGGLVDHRHDVTYTVALPRAHEWMQLGTPESYCKIHQGIKAVLQQMGIETQLAEKAQGEAGVCFKQPVKFDLICDDKKIAGAAQRRTREGFLQQGSILLPNPTSEQNAKLIQLFPQVMGEALNFDWELSELTAAESDCAQQLEKSRYATEEWNKSK